ncbi:hypothetical protein E2C01_006817 [Portunus trituberculatus]|uniref:Uncharacterized protein n=1 Tax=Portunus trituberculatus TaxID=210409 RepID=A0A5B7CZ60_PORTR|nr:hypothetical protein [Portunus trituberculatus]
MLPRPTEVTEGGLRPQHLEGHAVLSITAAPVPPAAPVSTAPSPIHINCRKEQRLCKKVQTMSG